VLYEREYQNNISKTVCDHILRDVSRERRIVSN